MSESVDPLPTSVISVTGEQSADAPAPVYAEPAPVLGPIIGVVGSVLCALVGALLLLAPFAFDYRQGASAMPRSSVVDLAGGGGILLVGILTAALFGGTLGKRLRVPEAVEAYAPESFDATAADPEETEFLFEPQAEFEHAAPPEPAAEQANALRDLLTPLVAALAADLKAREQGTEPEPGGNQA